MVDGVRTIAESIVENLNLYNEVCDFFYDGLPEFNLRQK